MNASFAACIVAALAPFSVLARVQDPPAPKPAEKSVDEKKKPDIYDEKADARADIAAALLRAKKENRRVLIQWGGNWCSWCHLLHERCKSDADLRKKLMYEYDVVLVDAARNGKNLDLADQYGADLKKNGVPFLTVLDSDGKVLANQESSSLEAKIDGKDGHDPKKVLGFLTKQQAPYLEADDLYDAALAQAKTENKRVFVHFGAPWCSWCHKLEGWMASKDIAPLLAKDFVELKIDTDRTIGGAAMLSRIRGPKEGGIPWIVIFDANGKELCNSNDAKGENIGFPAEPQEIEVFGNMLKKACVNLTAEEIERIKASLVPPPKKDVAKKEG